jgi:hypothetical protein
MSVESRPPSDPKAPCTKGPAKQPHDPGADCKPPGSSPQAPSLPDPKPCETCCECPGKPPSGANCFDDLIAKETKTAAMADRAKAFKADLEALQQKTKAALQDYTDDKYKELLSRWTKLDADIVEFIKKLVCAIPCWWCVVECEICPLLYAVRDLERKLYGTGTHYAKVDSLLDLQYWWSRERDVRLATLNRVKNVMTAWEKPAATIDKVLTDNANFIQNSGNILASNTATLLYELFFKVVPLHLAIAPPASVRTTGIESKYVELCPCDDAGPPDDCCGPNVGVLSLRERLVGPQPFLIAPSKYVDLVCCLANTRYHPAKEAWADADSEVSKITDVIARITADIGAKTTSLPQDAKARLSKPIDCQQYKPKEQSSRPPSDQGCCGENDDGPKPAAAAPKY